jgi:hypothetical protein
MKNTSFSSLYRQYRNAPLSSGERYRIYKRMVRNARSFNDWAIIYRYGDNSYQYLAEEHMKAKVLKGKTSTDVQKNILNLFEIVTDENEQNEILKAFLSKYDSQDDVLFVMTLSPWLVTGFEGMYYMSIDDIDKVISEKEKHLQKMKNNSEFLN